MSGDFTGVRFSPHVYNTLEEVEHVVDAVARSV
jgi:selenocysteine lyase/cysteine desulfurase